MCAGLIEKDCCYIESAVLVAVPLAAPEVCSSCFQLVNESTSQRNDVIIYFHVCMIAVTPHTFTVHTILNTSCQTVHICIYLATTFNLKKIFFIFGMYFQ